MKGSTQPVLRDIVLVGGGHSHVVVLRSFGMKPMPGVRLTLICHDSYTPYSGMLPGYIAGHYSYDEVHIDLCRLAEFAGAALYRDEAVGIDRENRRVICRNRPPVRYDRLSINIGSSPQLAQVEGAAAHALPVKPIFQFNQRWLALLQRVRERQGPFTIAVVGAGAGGVELTLAMLFRLRAELRTLGRDPDALRFHLLDSAPRILPSHNRMVRGHLEQLLRQRGVLLHLGAEVRQVLADGLVTGTGERIEADEVVWVTRASAAAWLGDTGLALDADGFLRVNNKLQSTSDPAVFAAGDVASMAGRPLEKAGVFAVRQGKPLAENLRRSLLDLPLRPYRPQRRWLALIGTGGRHAVASRGALGWQGDWVWNWKEWIDRRFMRRFSELPAPGMAVAAAALPLALLPLEAQQAQSAVAMRCGGCGAKVGADALSRALGALAPVLRDDVLVGLHAPDDAAVLRVPPGKAVVHTVDFFRAFINDPWLFGKIAANHALGDIFAMGAKPQSATAIATLPPGLESKVEDQLFQMMAGAVEVLNEAGCALVGGHSGEGGELALGFAVNGLIDEDLRELTRKGGMRAGERLILTKALGTGTLLVALARWQAQGRWIDAALASMLQSSRLAATCLREHGASACTDVTGFGLLGHLLEMVQPSGMQVQLDLDALPLLDGAAETAAAGWLSSLQPANRKWERLVHQTAATPSHPAYPLLFDPQTAGGLLASVPAAHAEACVAALHSLGYGHACVIGQVLAPDDSGTPVRLKE